MKASSGLSGLVQTVPTASLYVSDIQRLYSLAYISASMCAVPSADKAQCQAASAEQLNVINPEAPPAPPESETSEEPEDT